MIWAECECHYSSFLLSSAKLFYADTLLLRTDAVWRRYRPVRLLLAVLFAVSLYRFLFMSLLSLPWAVPFIRLPVFNYQACYVSGRLVSLTFLGSMVIDLIYIILVIGSPVGCLYWFRVRALMAMIFFAVFDFCWYKNSPAAPRADALLSDCHIDVPQA